MAWAPSHCLPGPVAEERDWLLHQRFLIVRPVSLEHSPRGVDGVDAIADFVGAESPVFVIEAVGAAVGRCDVELDQVDMLADHVGRRANLEIVELVNAGDEVGLPVLDDVTAVGSEEERLGRRLPSSVSRTSPQRARMRCWGKW